MKKSLLLIFTILLPLFNFSQDLSVTQKVTDDSDELNTAKIVIDVQGGQAPYQYFWSEKSVDTKTSVINGATEGKEYSVKVVDANGKEKELTFEVPTNSVPESMSAAFAPVVGFMDTYFFFDPFHAIGLYDNRVKDENGVVLKNPNGTDRTIKVPFMVIWLILGALFFTLRFRFINFRGIKHSLDLVRGKYDDPEAIGEVTHFQALATAVSGTVGLGNIAGVAVAVATGGPGATFWLILAGLLGMSSKFVECTLGVKYRTLEEDGTISGGPMEYLKKGFAERGFKGVGKGLSFVYAVIIMLAAFAAGSMFQANQATAQLSSVLGVGGIAKTFIGIGIAVIVGIVIIGGLKGIAKVTEKVVPSMAALYILMCVIVIGANITEVGSAFSLIIDGAFNPQAIYGGFLGVLVLGFQRAAFSNEAGLGSASIAHSAAKTKHPVSEGFVALLEPFIDTVVVCTLTALVLIFTGTYQGEEATGSALTAVAFGKVIPGASIFLTIAIFLFAFSTILTWSYYGVQAAQSIFGETKLVTNIFKIVFLLTVVLGASIGLGAVIDFADMMFLTLAIPNLIGLYMMSGSVAKDLKAYMAKVKSGEIAKTK
ncbi:amino acid carrier protein [Winogradskyella sp. PC-19]|uniref:alanine/glycine:cation symporter family protein n=1 Tax=unclassified Winogradskyella TaxID=2615021 RepID=UPI000B3D290E|nr:MULTISPECIES: alanine/glycine:cation symporter family protein [unclassified Winogradskyella]ARV10418.1 amino acid carrier protein [Winogradskyella sp. PC-19]